VGGLSLASWTLNFTDCDSVDWKLKNMQSIRYLTRESTKKPAYRVERQAGIGFHRLNRARFYCSQVDRFHFSDESLVVIGEERTNHVEHGVTEATDFHDVSSFTSLNRLVRLQIDVYQLRASYKTAANAMRLMLCCQLALAGKRAAIRKNYALMHL
jgi:hypothetical protein